MLKILEELALRYPNNITLYKPLDVKMLMKSIGKIPGKFDNDLLDFLRFTNGASILDYCFLGFRNSKLGVDIDKFMLEFWSSQELFSGRVLGFMITSTSETFGYLIDTVDHKGRHPIVYCTSQGKCYLISSSFKIFMTQFVHELSNTLASTKETQLLYIEKNEWPIDLKYWVKCDPDLKETCKNENLKRLKNLILPIF